jgi:hypothetical protein
MRHEGRSGPRLRRVVSERKRGNGVCLELSGTRCPGVGSRSHNMIAPGTQGADAHVFRKMLQGPSVETSPLRSTLYCGKKTRFMRDAISHIPKA